MALTATRKGDDWGQTLWTVETDAGTVDVHAASKEEAVATVTAQVQDRPMRALRAKRNSKLAMSDWTHLSDAPIAAAKLLEWKTYRQALRDLPANTTDPATPAWSAAPA